MENGRIPPDSPDTPPTSSSCATTIGTECQNLEKPAAPTEDPEVSSGGKKRKRCGAVRHSPEKRRKEAPVASKSTQTIEELPEVSQIRDLKRIIDLEKWSTNKQRRNLELGSQLSERNLQELERETSESMDGRKRSSSKQTSASEVPSSRSQKPTVSNTFYRWKILYGASIYVHSRPPPLDLIPQLNDIFDREIVDARKTELSGIAREAAEAFGVNTRSANREDDLVEILYEALKKMCPKAIYAFVRKTDWNLNLKPIKPQNLFELNTHDERDSEVMGPPPKRQQGNSNTSIPSGIPAPPAAPVGMMPPPQDATIKTPRPDFTIGFDRSTVVDAMYTRGLSRQQGDRFLEQLQDQQRLFSDPTQSFSDVRFPILIIEGKGYATGKTIFEAENQAAVAGCCMINLLQQLTQLRNDILPPRPPKTPLAFSVCTQGPLIELWVHHLVIDDDGCTYHMNLLEACHGSLSRGLETMLQYLDRLMTWYKDDFLKEIADDLFAIAKQSIR
ncbi:MAG: hypothetical protein Q9219_004887 [cf. Caloplaca sp. 3 TL-2023]